jgi:hypothetical protein
LGFGEHQNHFTYPNYYSHMKDIADIDNGVVNWLKNISHKSWARYLFDYEVKVEYITNCMVKSFNH